MQDSLFDHETIGLSSFFTNASQVLNTAKTYRDQAFQKASMLEKEFHEAVDAQSRSLENDLLRDVYLMGYRAGLASKETPNE